MPEPNGVALGPGSYLIELRLAPGSSSSPEAVKQALEMAGMQDVIPDETTDLRMSAGARAMMGALGLAPGGLGSQAQPAAPASSWVPSLSPQHYALAAATKAAMPVAALQPKTVAPTQSTWVPSLSPHHYEMAAATKAAMAPQALTYKPVQTPFQAMQAAAEKTATAALDAAAKKKEKHGFGFLGGGDGGGGGGGVPAPTPGGGSAPAPETANLVPDAKDDRYATDQSTGQEYYMDPNSGTVYAVNKDGSLQNVDQQTLAPQPGSPLPPPPPPGTAGDQSLPGEVPTELPFGEDPAFRIQIGVAGPGGETYRVVARASRNVVLKSGPGVSWSVRALAIDPYAMPPSATKAFILESGRDYDLIVMARDRRARSRGDVWTLAEAMGFQPSTISLLQRDLHPPRRAGSSYSRWLLAATWRGPTTLTTAEEPLIFDQVALAS